MWAPPEGKDYKWYISGIFLPIGRLYATYHHLREPKTTIDKMLAKADFQGI